MGRRVSQESGYFALARGNVDRHTHTRTHLRVSVCTYVCIYTYIHIFFLLPVCLLSPKMVILCLTLLHGRSLRWRILNWAFTKRKILLALRWLIYVYFQFLYLSSLSSVAVLGFIASNFFQVHEIPLSSVVAASGGRACTRANVLLGPHALEKRTRNALTSGQSWAYVAEVALHPAKLRSGLAGS